MERERTVLFTPLEAIDDGVELNEGEDVVAILSKLQTLAKKERGGEERKRRGWEVVVREAAPSSRVFQFNWRVGV